MNVALVELVAVQDLDRVGDVVLVELAAAFLMAPYKCNTFWIVVWAGRVRP